MMSASFREGASPPAPTSRSRLLRTRVRDPLLRSLAREGGFSVDDKRYEVVRSKGRRMAESDVTSTKGYRPVELPARISAPMRLDHPNPLLRGPANAHEALVIDFDSDRTP